MVTGASDGIGKEYCKLLAEQGFNIVLVSRTLSKLQAVEQEILKAFPQVKTKVIQADFGDSRITSTNERVLEFYRGIKQECTGLDIALVVNNAGIMQNGNLDQ